MRYGSSEPVVEVTGAVAFGVTQDGHLGLLAVASEDEDRQGTAFHVLPLNRQDEPADELGVVPTLDGCGFRVHGVSSSRPRRRRAREGLHHDAGRCAD